MNNYQEAYDKCLNLIKNKKNIVLLGSGGNGKTYLINQLMEKLDNYKIFHEYSYSIVPTILSNNNFITAIYDKNEIKNIDSKLYEIIDMSNIKY